jgi:NADH:ubiquinone oxidoreductase subunit 4 (subunit M)
VSCILVYAGIFFFNFFGWSGSWLYKTAHSVTFSLLFFFVSAIDAVLLGKEVLKYPFTVGLTGTDPS